MDELTALLREHPERAMDALLSSYTGLVYQAVRAVLTMAPAADVEECVSDAFVYVYENRARLDFSEGSVKAYLCAVAKGKALDRLRGLQRRAVVPLDEAREAADCSAEEAALSRVERGELIRAIRDLGEPDSTILTGRYYLGLSTRKLASLLGLKENTVDQRARRALKRLAVTLKGGICHAE